MPKLLMQTKPASTALRKAASTLKAGIVVSAAAILSQAQADLEANAANALGHFDDFAQQLRAIRQSALPVAILSASYAESGTIAIETDALDRKIQLVDERLAAVRRGLQDVAGSAERSGIEVFTESVGQLGRAFQQVGTLLAANDADATPFMYDQFFLEAMQDLSQRDWRAS